jgi:hypothetical protein
MALRLIEEVDDFLAAAGPYLRSDPVHNTVPLTVLAALDRVARRTRRSSAGMRQPSARRTARSCGHRRAHVSLRRQDPEQPPASQSRIASRLRSRMHTEIGETTDDQH